MAIDFPNSPTVGQMYTVGNRSWRYDGEKWVAVDPSVNAQNQLYDIMVLMNMETN
jgi:hypothetical protein